MFTILFTLLVSLSRQRFIEAHSLQVNDVCDNFPVEHAGIIIKEYFKNVPEISIFPMYADWSTCVVRLSVRQEMFSLKMFDSVHRYNTNWNLNIDGILLTALRKVDLSNTTNILKHRNFEDIGMMIMVGDINRSLGSIRSATKMLPRMVALIVDNIKGSTLCSINRHNILICTNVTNVYKLDLPTNDSPEQITKSIKVSMFPNLTVGQPVINQQGEVVRARFVDAEMLNIVSNMLNVTPVHLDTTDFGYQLSNGTFVGALADVEYGRADLANYRIITYVEGANNVQFSVPLSFIRFNYVVPKNYYLYVKREINISVFRPEFTVLYFTIIIWFPLGLKLIEYYNSKFTSLRTTSWSLAVVMTFAAMTNMSITIREMSSQRAYWMGLIWFQLIVYSVFQGNMVKEVNNAKISRNIDTLDELMKTQLKLVLHESMTDFVKFEEKTFQQYNLVNRITLGEYDTKDLMVKIIQRRETAVLLPEHLITSVVPAYYDPKTGDNLLHVVPEVAYKFYVAMYVPATSLIIEPLNHITLMCVESGIILYQLNLMDLASRLMYIRRFRNGKFEPEEKRQAMVGWNALKTYFIFSVLILMMAGIVFIFEILFYRISKRNSMKFGTKLRNNLTRIKY